MHLRCPHCQNPIELAGLPSAGEVTCAGCGSSFMVAAPSTVSWQGPANQRLGKFEVLGTVGQGAFGTVLKAHDTELDRIVAIKIPRAGNVGPTPEDVDRFLREARSVAQLRFPSIIAIHEVGAENGAPYLVCDFVEGVTLADRLTGRGFTFTAAAELIAQVADALQYAHALGIVHRDVKPSNIMIRPDGSPCVMDFGLAKRDAGEITMTIDGQILGTPAYMSPEQARGEGHRVDGKSDVYSLGVILYQLLTGELPFRGNKTMLLHQVLHEEPLRPRALNDKIPRDLETIALKAMAKEPARRYASARDMADDLRRWAAGEPILARPVGALERAWRWCKRKPALSGLSAALAAVIVTAFAVVLWQLHETVTAQQQRALAQVNAVCDAAPGAVPGILADLEANRATVLPHLRWRFAEEADRPKRMRLALALLPVNPDAMRDDLAAWMLQARDPAETLLVRDVLEPYSADLTGSLWKQADDLARPRPERFRALVALARFDPASARWQDVAPDATDELLTANALHLGSWVEAFRPVRMPLLPALGDVYRGKRLAEHRQVAADVLADYAADQPSVLAELLMDADEKQFVVIYPKFKEEAERGLPVLIAEIDKRLPPELPASDPDREKLAKRQASAAVALLKTNQPQKVWPLLKHSPDPRVRSYLIDRFAPLGADPRTIVRRLNEEPDVTIRRALILSLGDFRDKDWSADDRHAVTKEMKQVFRTASDPGLHAACEWLLRTWKHEAWLKKTQAELAEEKEQRKKKIAAIKQMAAEDKEMTLPQWYVTGQGQTMVVITALEPFLMGSPPTEAGRYETAEKQYKKRIGRTFAVAAKLVTLEQFLKMRKEYFGKYYATLRKFAPDDDCPAIGLEWHGAAEYCNWLSEKEGIDPAQWCYEMKGEVAKPKMNHLSLSGYRLPTEAEMEYSMRAGASTSRYYGETQELLPKYAWYIQNAKDRAWPVGGKMPNDFGLFDAQGNAFTWCADWYRPGDEIFEDRDQKDDAKDTGRVLRGSSFVNIDSWLRSARRNYSAGTTFSYGFRVARTIVP